ncbi:amino acid ABC transporter permease [Brucella tritici]|uniref:Amino acid ABC transporter permease n=2 Tax=Brucella/Ochrobactrum group TaxID=2826938 RepID=A0A7V8B0G9_9HYPH|nr:amino acid ABC transporter permease [Brucella tritici]KXO77634.1 polar amino acid ABC transporter permease [Brucella anthropi]
MNWAVTALVVALVVVIASWKTLRDINAALTELGMGGIITAGLLLLCGLATLLLLKPAMQSWRLSTAARQALATNDLISARAATATARDSAYSTLGYGAVTVLLLTGIQFLLVNDLAVSRTFLQIPLIASSFWLVLKAFWVNVYIFVIAEILVLIWGLIVAIARLMPGEAGRPVRLIATVYTDMFRGLPAIINIYLIGFGIPLTGLPYLKDLSPESYAIIALTLTYGAYVAEVYRAGIESIHRSQVAAARSLGLSYFQTLRYVVVPQAVRRIIPPLLNDFIGLQKDTALVNVIGSIDAFNQARIIGANNFNLSPVTTVALLFILITIPQARFVDRLLEREQRRTQS